MPTSTSRKGKNLKDYIYTPALTREQFQELADNAAFKVTVDMILMAVFAALALLCWFAFYQLNG